jgi:ATP-dependent exoDNAse (exonuclease V) alpha subunit
MTTTPTAWSSSAGSAQPEDTLDKLLIEQRIGHRPRRRYDLLAGTTVIVDEAGMVPTAKLAELATLAEQRQWRIALVGDPLQFSAIGRGGMFAHLVDTFGTVELDQVHRFHNAWERGASLRRGDLDVVDDYDAHGRIHCGSSIRMERGIIDRWWMALLDGLYALVMAPSNEVVERLNYKMQRRLLPTGDLHRDGLTTTTGSYTLHVGDDIVTRRNDRSLYTDHGEVVKNRATWTITAIERDGAMRATGTSGNVRLPADYVSESSNSATPATR